MSANKSSKNLDEKKHNLRRKRESELAMVAIDESKQTRSNGSNAKKAKKTNEKLDQKSSVSSNNNASNLLTKKEIKEGKQVEEVKLKLKKGKEMENRSNERSLKLNSKKESGKAENLSADSKINADAPSLIKVGPAINDDIILKVDTHEFDVLEEEVDNDEFGSDKDLDQQMVEEVVTLTDLDCDGNTFEAGTIQGVVQQVENFEKGLKEGSKDSAEEYQKLLKNETLKRVFNQFYNDRINETTAASKQGEKQLNAVKEVVKDVQNKTPDRVKNTNQVKSPSDTTLYVPALRLAVQDNEPKGMTHEIANIISNFVEAVR